MVLSIFSRAYRPLEYFLLINFYSGSCRIKNWVIWLYSVVLKEFFMYFGYKFFIIRYVVGKYFLSFYELSFEIHSIVYRMRSIISTKSILSFIAVLLETYQRKCCLFQGYEYLLCIFRTLWLQLLHFQKNRTKGIYH